MYVTFCGHSEVAHSGEVRAWLRSAVEELISADADVFYLGGYGAFDRLAAEAVREAKVRHPHISAVLVLAYLNDKTDPSAYDCTVYPPIENTPLRYAISRRNQWMVDNSDVIVAYVLHDWGGAASTLDYARRKKKRIIAYCGKPSEY